MFHVDFYYKTLQFAGFIGRILSNGYIILFIFTPRHMCWLLFKLWHAFHVVYICNIHSRVLFMYGLKLKDLVVYLWFSDYLILSSLNPFILIIIIIVVDTVRYRPHNTSISISIVVLILIIVVVHDRKSVTISRSNSRKSAT